MIYIITLFEHVYVCIIWEREFVEVYEKSALQ